MRSRLPRQGFVYIHRVRMGRFLWRHGLGCATSRVRLHSPRANGTIFMTSRSGLCHVKGSFTFTEGDWDDFYDVMVWAVPHQGFVYIHWVRMGWFLWRHGLGCAMSRVCLHSPSVNGTIFMMSWSGLCHVNRLFTFTKCEWDDFYDVTVWAVPHQGSINIHQWRMGWFLWRHGLGCATSRVCLHSLSANGMIFMTSRSGLCHVKGLFTFTECEWDDFYDVMVWAVPCQSFVYIHQVRMGWFLWRHSLGCATSRVH